MTRTNDDTTWCLQGARAGSQEDLGRALESCRDPLLKIARRELDDPNLNAKGDASDLVQRTFLDAHKDFDRFIGRTRNDLLHWLAGLLYHNLSKFRRWFRQGKRCANIEVSLDAGSSAGGALPLVCETPSPSRHAMKNENVDRLQMALQQLPEEYRQVIALRYEEERSWAEIGRIMGRSENGAQKLWGRAIKKLQEKMKDLQ